MIGRIRGTLVHKQPPDVLVDVGGVGYEVQVPLTTLFELPEVGAEITLVTHFVVREDAQQLYGFLRERDRGLFRQLIRVNGVGPKLGLAILSGMDADSFVRCVQREDIKALVALPGVGKRTAERLLVDMRSKLEDWTLPVSYNGGAPAAPVPIEGGEIGAEVDVGQRRHRHDFFSRITRRVSAVATASPSSLLSSMRDTTKIMRPDRPVLV